ncbi:MAG: hypothetical protein KIT27_04835 [Legionellales bacterium]|nr:hypothetical protein [Legionellales bacterium]
MVRPLKTLKPDAKGRIYLGELAEGISSFAVHVDKHHRIILDPLVEIPAREKWLFDNKSALQAVKQGLEEAKEGKLHDLGSFAKYANKDETE